MYAYDLDSTKPNQSMSVTIDEHEFSIALQTAGDLIFATVDVDGKRVTTSNRVVPFGWLIPYPAYIPSDCGNFRFVCTTSDYPEFSRFNTGCILVYYSREEYDKLKR